MKKILVIKAHPREDSYCHTLVEQYINGAEASGHETGEVTLKNLELEKYLKYGHVNKEELTRELLEIREMIIWSNHLVFAYPTWWAVPPALMKVFLEMILLPGFAFNYPPRKKLIPKQKKLLKGKSARLFVTMGSPPLYYRLILGDPGYKMMKANMNFCGIEPVYRSYFGSIDLSSGNKRKSWLKKAFKIGLNE